MLEVSVTVQNGAEVQMRLANLARAAEVFGASKATIGSDDPVAVFVQEGTRPHVIYPRGPHSIIATRQAVAGHKALFWPGAAHPVGLVHHPGTKANPFLSLALASVRGAVESYVSNQLDMVASGAGSNYGQIISGAAKIVLEAAKQDAPVRTGALRASLYIVSG